MNYAYLFYLTAGAVLITRELLGVHSRRKNDTISEMYWWLQRRAGWAARLPLIAFLVWLVLHLTLG